MKEFFHGWRGKAGVVTLVIACVFAGAWMRSRAFNDTLQIRHRGTLHQLESFWGCITWWRLEADDPLVGAKYSKLVSWHWISNAHDYWGRTPSFYFVSDSWTIRYWAIALPLTLLSAYLILWNPRKRANQDA